MLTRKELEADLEKQCGEHIKSLGGLFLKIKLENERGFMDRMIVLNGEISFAELKISDGSGKVSPHQKKWINKMRRQGIPTEVFDNFEVFKDYYS